MSEKKSFWRWIGRIFGRRPPREEKVEEREEEANDSLPDAEVCGLPPESSEYPKDPEDEGLPSESSECQKDPDVNGPSSESSEHPPERTERENTKIHWDEAKLARLREAFMKYEKELEIKANSQRTVSRGPPANKEKSKIGWNFPFCCFGRGEKSKTDVYSNNLQQYCNQGYDSQYLNIAE
ncbi:uncharacterized protein LOC111630177 [Centruroides sculpturatus]|uniref:uncharacterized protein LOC111630177 n=1 Tax=Centruroides sculpturatus TaxID=218467 RepID=UPI000C6DE64D|nr:uncharacterized protein LOC111630177 [Centruroides sculpturatus]